tara:strand:- start:48677 stop:49567 length:891 start_codon:yes stop_codon:yes gene_type:complete
MFFAYHKNLYIIILISLFIQHSSCSQEKQFHPTDIPNLLCFWDFQEDSKLTSKGEFSYVLKEMNGDIESVDDGIFGKNALNIKKGQWLMIDRKDSPGLDINGKREVSMVAWVKRGQDGIWQYIAGVWNERDKQRQYALFTCGHKQSDYTTLNRTDARNRAHGYVSDLGGATKDRPYCFSYATGKKQLEIGEWNMIAFTYDHESIKVYFNGELDENGNYNPFYWDKPIFDGGENGADFTVAQRALPAWPGYPEVEKPTHGEGFAGLLGGLAVYDRALKANEIENLYKSSMVQNSFRK